jgi:hypothetical protein
MPKKSNVSSYVVPTDYLEEDNTERIQQSYIKLIMDDEDKLKLRKASK